MNHKIIFLTFGLLILAIFFCGCTTQPTKPIQPIQPIQPENELTTINTTIPTTIPPPYQVNVNYTADWFGKVSIDGESIWDISGHGPKTYEIPSDAISDSPWHYIVAEIYRRDKSVSTEITLELLKSGNIVAQGSSLSNLRLITEYYPKGKPAVAAIFVGTWDKYNQNQTAIDELINVHFKEPAINSEKLNLRKELGLPWEF